MDQLPRAGLEKKYMTDCMSRDLIVHDLQQPPDRSRAEVCNTLPDKDDAGLLQWPLLLAIVHCLVCYKHLLHSCQTVLLNAPSIIADSQANAIRVMQRKTNRQWSSLFSYAYVMERVIGHDFLRLNETN